MVWMRKDYHPFEPYLYTQTIKQMTLQEKLYDKAMLDALPDAEELAFAFMDDPVLCYDAVVHYLHFRCDRWEELAKNYK